MTILVKMGIRWDRNIQRNYMTPSILKFFSHFCFLCPTTSFWKVLAKSENFAKFGPVYGVPVSAQLYVKSITLRCLHSLSKCVASTLVELPQGLAGGDCCFLFERDPLPKPRTQSFLYWATLEPASIM